MLSPKKWSLLAITLVAASTPAITAADDAPQVSAPAASAVTANQDPCKVRYRQKTHERYVKAVYRRDRVSMVARRKARKMRSCSYSVKATRNMRGVLRREVRDRRMRIVIEAVTPFSGPDGTRWAIPWRGVYCESKGSWSAYNSSGAAGPYQIMSMHGRPWPVRTMRDKMKHHRIAARLWAGGRGARNWVCPTR